MFVTATSAPETVYYIWLLPSSVLTAIRQSLHESSSSGQLTVHVPER